MSETLKSVTRYLVLATIGILFHFTYEWSGNNTIAGLFTPTSESVWEHLKLLFFPMLLATIWDALRGNTTTGFLKKRIISIMVGMVVIIVLFYTSMGVSGRIIGWFNIASYLIALLIALILDKVLNIEDNPYSAYTALATFVLFTVAFAVFSFKSPEVGIFYPFPENATYFPIIAEE